MDELRGLWRGKRKVYHNYETEQDVFEWTEGYLKKAIDFYGKVQYSIITELNEHFIVDPSTLGECTGKRDKNGTLIFEGDIVDYNGTKHEVVFETRFSAYFGIKISHIETWQFCLEVPAKLMEVIGNIHDTPRAAEPRHGRR